MTTSASQTHGYDTVQRAASYLRERLPVQPRFSLTLGSGLGGLADEIEGAVRIPYAEIPDFPVSTAPGHAGELVAGTLAGQPVMAYKGRVHFYEGYRMEQVIFPVRVAYALGARDFLITSACGGLRDDWSAGDLMLHRDYINMTGTNPLIGPNDTRLGERFPGMYDAYDPEYAEVVRSVARAQDLNLREGVYVSISGPSYASRAELRAFRLLGADAIGMSTVPEVIAARHLGARVIGLSTVTDLAIPEREHHADEQEVIQVAQASSQRFRALIKGVLERL
ncbi:purine-nucleoside phosphorylase [Deinobacterium chartae]|uniref:Purine nucleoside phosphorylase n=1 Tax=Deinobacterium chartae TaxID=521158 RepID=A0A841HTF7_9DEIO|nr:purine-nucleoside phosphorylase [Deinobacterium chartae]MBB6096637.1 purine-nucleoside phosphorylase [Deinobacterium chartae]